VDKDQGYRGVETYAEE
jgi:hypothetical protein